MKTEDWITLIISSLALLISIIILRLSYFFKGKIKITKPSIICFLGENGSDESKILLRTLIYSTAEKGHYIQNMYITLRNEIETVSLYNWGYGEDKLVYGSGLFINKTGVLNNHHFFLPDGSDWKIREGKCEIEIFIENVDDSVFKLYSLELNINQENLTNYEKNMK